MKVIRSHHEANCTIIPNSTIRDGRLSRLARSILIELLSNPSHWPHATAEKMWAWDRQQRGDRADGRLAYMRAFNELVDAGYMFREIQRRGTALVTLVTVYDTPRTPRHGPDGSGRSGREKSGPDRTNTRSTDARRKGNEGGPSGSETSTPKEAAAERRDGFWDLLARIPDWLLLSPEADRATLGRKAVSLLRQGLGADQLRALLSCVEGLGRPFGALLRRMANLKNALAFLDGKLGRGVHRPWGSSAGWPESGGGFGEGAAEPAPMGPDPRGAFDAPPRFVVDVNGAAVRTCPEHPTVRNVPGGCCALCGGPRLSEPGPWPAKADQATPGPVSGRSLQMEAGLVPVPRTNEVTFLADAGESPGDEELDPDQLERMHHSLDQGRQSPQVQDDSDTGAPGAPPDWAEVRREPGVARAGAALARQALARTRVTTGGGPGGG
ncbi:hypothetical protein NE857_16500 [Nocardiopsis exhalans]|uniref:Helix-turn-helix domain-containing protein n=1 Tax=Nocardiopsis exhalans TaxID=163604 RepID=A0ABY5DHQ9_9ACTN|nr:hypothetical protein [Nocardiopsis exhalans]USY23073.1 hypothetical protein NE857_16500 [Nocardiopsis exhalans]